MRNPLLIPSCMFALLLATNALAQQPQPKIGHVPGTVQSNQPPPTSTGPRSSPVKSGAPGVGVGGRPGQLQHDYGVLIDDLTKRVAALENEVKKLQTNFVNHHHTYYPGGGFAGFMTMPLVTCKGDDACRQVGNNEIYVGLGPPLGSRGPVAPQNTSGPMTDSAK